ncbi:hypothetical protein NMG60_11020021 [Bertholletia excelsa]
MADLQIIPACKNVEAQYVEMRVPLYSYGCERKVKKALSHLRGIYSVNVDFNQQKVIVWGICNKYDVLETIKKKRKEAQFWNEEDNAELEKQREREREREREKMIKVGMVVELLEEYRVAMARVREQLLLPRRLRMRVQILRSLRSASTSPLAALDSSSFLVYF